MKIVEMWDFVSLERIKSFYMKDRKTIAFDNDKPYTMNNALSPECFIGGPCYVLCSDDSYFLALNEFDGVPPYDPDVDIVFYCNERVGLMDEFYEKYSVDTMRKQFPNAVIVGKVKEIPPHFNSGSEVLSPGEGIHRQKRPERPNNRIRFFNDCDYVLVGGEPNGSFSKIPYFEELKKNIDTEIVFIPGTYNIDYLFEKFYSEEKSNSIYVYEPTVHDRRGNTMEFAAHMGEKYNLPVYFKSKNENYSDGNKFLNLWSSHLYIFNLDPYDIQPGWHCLQVANVGSINIGGENDSHHLLFPETATCRWDLLEEQFVKYYNDEKERFKAVEYAWNKLNELFSPNSVGQQIKDAFLND